MYFRTALSRPVASFAAATGSLTRSFGTSALAYKSFAALVKEIKATNKDIHEMGPQELGAALLQQSSSSEAADKPIVVDCREMSEITKTGTIPGALPLPRGILERDVQKFLPNPEQNTRNIVVYCAGGFRSVLAAESLVRLGYATDGKVTSLEQGFDGWVKAGFPVQDVASKK
ncbi:hypothetical protein DFQ27_001562 [Actinomortierella ambigua]|uniref:Rhodanese domain-containing protein n=1 Tax=Actinomortierella ambigua TaxID=1343610 RepID=A0A9P6QBY6_9FUNG|nr:hypothetical protein DFQ27_001562 [Actinomortierella ambigua]